MARWGTASLFAAGVIATNRTCIEGWHNAGYPGAIPAPEKIANVRNYGAVGDGVTDDYAAIIAARNSLGGAGVIYFPAGTYKCNTSIVLNQNGQVIRGQRAVNTRLLFNIPAVMETSHSIKITGGGAGAWQSMTAGYGFGSRTITVTNPTAFVAGEYAETRQVNDPSWALPTPGWQDYACGQVVHIVAITNTTLYLETPLRFDYQSDKTPQIRPINSMRKHCGVENISFQQVSNGLATARDNVCTVFFYLAAGGWVRGVIGLDGFGGHVGAQESIHIEVTGSYFDNAIDHDGGGSGYGVRLEYKTSEILTENNIFTKLRHSMLVQAGANGNVFGYNYSREGNKDGLMHGASDITLHGTYPYANLFEGNLVNFMNPDDSHAANGPWNTFFRNRAIWNGFRITDTRIRDANIVGNECRNDGEDTGDYAPFYNLGFGDGYELQGSNHYAYGNAAELDGNPEPAGFSGLTDYSYYLGTDPAVEPPLPDWWTVGTDVRVIGPILPGDMPINLTAAVTNPAKARYDAAGIMTVGVPSIAFQPTNTMAPSGSTASFSVTAFGNGTTTYQWYHGTGMVSGATASNLVINPVSMSDSGTYYCVLSDDDGSVSSATRTLTILPPVFALVSSWTPGMGGAVNPAGSVNVTQGGSTSFVVQAAAYYRIESVRTNGWLIGGLPVTNRWVVAWPNVTATGALQVVFVSRQTSNGTPYVWLASNGLLAVDSMVAAESADLANGDSDDALNWQEYRAGTQPTNGDSVLCVGVFTPTNATQGLLAWPSVAGKRYDIMKSSHLPGGFMAYRTNILAEVPTNRVSVPLTNNPVFYRVRLAE